MKELNWVMRWKGTGGQNLRWMVKGRLPQGSHTGLEAIPVTGAGGGGAVILLILIFKAKNRPKASVLELGERRGI